MAGGEEATNPLKLRNTTKHMAIRIKSSVLFLSLANSTDHDSVGSAFCSHLLRCCSASTVKFNQSRRSEFALSSLQHLRKPQQCYATSKRCLKVCPQPDLKSILTTSQLPARSAASRPSRPNVLHRATLEPRNDPQIQRLGTQSGAERIKHIRRLPRGIS